MTGIALKSLSAFGLASIVAISSPMPAQSANTTLKSFFSVAFKGVPVGTFKNVISLKGDRYAIDGVVRTNKFVSIVANTKAFIQASGKIAGTKVIPTKQVANYKSGKKRGNTSLVFSGNDVIKAKAVPALKPKPDRVPLQPSHSRNVLDPVSALVFPVKNGARTSGAEVCNRTVPIFDGNSRMTLKLSYKGRARARAKGYSGEVYRCAVKYIPVAGHRSKNRGTIFMKSRSDIEIRMARVGNSNVFALFGFTVPTRAGIITANATQFQAR